VCPFQVSTNHGGLSAFPLLQCSSCSPCSLHLSQPSAARSCSIAWCVASMASRLWPQKSCPASRKSLSADSSAPIASWMFGQRFGTGTAMGVGAGAAMAADDVKVCDFGAPNRIAKPKAVMTTVKVIRLLFIFLPKTESLDYLVMFESHSN